MRTLPYASGPRTPDNPKENSGKREVQYECVCDPGTTGCQGMKYSKIDNIRLITKTE